MPKTTFYALTDTLVVVLLKNRAARYVELTIVSLTIRLLIVTSLIAFIESSPIAPFDDTFAFIFIVSIVTLGP